MSFFRLSERMLIENQLTLQQVEAAVEEYITSLDPVNLLIFADYLEEYGDNTWQKTIEVLRSNQPLLLIEFSPYYADDDTPLPDKVTGTLHNSVLILRKNMCYLTTTFSITPEITCHYLDAASDSYKRFAHHTSVHITMSQRKQEMPKLIPFIIAWACST